MDTSNGSSGTPRVPERRPESPHLIERERQSSLIRAYENAWVPGLLQSEGYVRASTRSSEEFVAARLERQRVIHAAEPTAVWAILDEFILHRPVGGPEVMRDQVRHLLELSELPHVAIRIVPRTTGAYIGLDGTFMILSLPDGDVVYREAAREAQLVSLPSEVREFQIQYDEIGQHALPVGQTRDLLRRIAEEL